MTDVTLILNAIEQGDAGATDELLPLVYEELRLLAAQKLSQERPGQTLQATALVHEAYLRLVKAKDQSWNSRGWGRCPGETSRGACRPQEARTNATTIVHAYLMDLLASPTGLRQGASHGAAASPSEPGRITAARPRLPLRCPNGPGC